MTLQRLMTACVIAAGIGSVSMVASPAHAQSAMEAEIIGFHQLCDKGDRKACVRFGTAAMSSVMPTGAAHTPTGSGSNAKPRVEEAAGNAASSLDFNYVKFVSAL